MQAKALAYAQAYLQSHNAERDARPGYGFRSRAGHSRRVCLWAERLLAHEPADCVDALRLAAALHDVGYATGVEPHGHASAEILEAYARAQAIPEPVWRQAAFLVREHSDKDRWLADPDAPRDLVLLMEADLLDEEGAMGLVLDCMSAASLGAQGYGDALARMQAYEPSRLSENPMVTPTAQKIWKEKQRMIRDFMRAFAYDLGIEYEP